MQSLSLYKRLLSYVKPYWKIVVLSILSTGLYATTDPILVKLMQPLIDEGITNANMDVVKKVLIFSCVF